MSNISIGANFILTGMVVVFITLTVMSAAMWLVGKLLIGGKGRNQDARAPQKSSDLDTGELASVAIAIDRYNSEKERYGAVALDFEQPSRWKTQGRTDSLERGI
jgi:Na+-transporting methylmalonyl-CoA/oxaloacetate decarboxylase gamma subunit